MIVAKSRENVLRWYTGKALTNAQEALDLLAASETAGEWVPKASRRCRSVLAKSNVAHKLVNGFQRDALGWHLTFALLYGCDGLRLANARTEKVKTSNLLILEGIRRGQEYLDAMEPLYALMTKLDATRPKPTFTSLGVSPTVTSLLTSLGVTGRLSTIRMCPLKWISIERSRCDGSIETVWVARLDWPLGTVHNASRYANTDNQHAQCHSCGHAIKNAFNWVPILIDNEKGIPHSLWVGRDCAKSLFGITMAGILEIETA